MLGAGVKEIFEWKSFSLQKDWLGRTTILSVDGVRDKFIYLTEVDGIPSNALA